jgi:ABC-type transporter Mla subunit MlaD
MLEGCSRDPTLTARLPIGGDLQQGDSVLMSARQLGTVTRITRNETSPGITVEFSLDAELADRVQSNAFAFLALDGAPALVLANPAEESPPVVSGDQLSGLSPMDAAIWHAGQAAGVFSDMVDQFSQGVVDYLESDHWAQTQAEIETEIAELAAESQQAAEAVVEDLTILFDRLNDEAADSAEQLDDELQAIEGAIEQLRAEGHEQLSTALSRLLEQLKGLEASPDTEPPTIDT